MISDRPDRSDRPIRPTDHRGRHRTCNCRHHPHTSKAALYLHEEVSKLRGPLADGKKYSAIPINRSDLSRLIVPIWGLRWVSKSSFSNL